MITLSVKEALTDAKHLRHHRHALSEAQHLQGLLFVSVLIFVALFDRCSGCLGGLAHSWIDDCLREFRVRQTGTTSLKPAEVKRVNVDTTVQEKTITFPTDARLYHKARRVLVRLARVLPYQLRQSYERVGKQALVWQGCYAAAQQMKRARQLRTYLGRVLRNLDRFVGPLTERQARLLVLARRIFEQRCEDGSKVYSVHASEVECIAKGKAAQKRYEFGCKVSLVTTNRSNWVVGIEAAPAIRMTVPLCGLRLRRSND